jgi:hypothetical protein
VVQGAGGQWWGGRKYGRASFKGAARREGRWEGGEGVTRRVMQRGWV